MCVLSRVPCLSPLSLCVSFFPFPLSLGRKDAEANLTNVEVNVLSLDVGDVRAEVAAHKHLRIVEEK